MEPVPAPMHPLLGGLDRAAAYFNDLPLWKRTGRVWGQAMASPTFERWLYLRAHQLGLMGRAERRFLERFIRPGMRILDVGSNLGLYSILMARRTGPGGSVLCFEPDPVLCGTLRLNQRLNHLANLEVHELAVGSAAAELVLHRSIVNTGDNHLGRADSALFRRSVTVRVVRLDEQMPGLAVDFIKIDVQGWELEAMQGMTGILRANPQVSVLFEFSQIGRARAGHSGEDLIAFLRAHGFRIFDPANSRELDDPAIGHLAKRLAAAGYTNLLAARQPPHPGP